MALTNTTTQEHVVLGDIRKSGTDTYTCTPRFYKTKSDRDYEKLNGRTPAYTKFETRDTQGNIASGNPTNRTVTLTKDEYVDALSATDTIDEGITTAVYNALKATPEFTGFIDE